jgi:hypothetical protein
MTLVDSGVGGRNVIGHLTDGFSVAFTHGMTEGQT